MFTADHVRVSGWSGQTDSAFTVGGLDAAAVIIFPATPWRWASWSLVSSCSCRRWPPSLSGRYRTG